MTDCLHKRHLTILRLVRLLKTAVVIEIFSHIFNYYITHHPLFSSSSHISHFATGNRRYFQEKRNLPSLHRSACNPRQSSKRVCSTVVSMRYQEKREVHDNHIRTTVKDYVLYYIIRSIIFIYAYIYNS
jgi:hypothetical protein